MTAVKLSPQYDPTSIESDIYAMWVEAGVFAASAESDAQPYVILIPPPNVTANLHMGHGLNNTLQDLLIRFERMRGRNALWLPGTDHAGIATQNVVERALKVEGKRKEDLGREAFVERVWEHVHKTGGTIIEQLKSIGSSCDWSRTWFTLDEGLSAAVREVFVRLYEKGLIYRGKYIINWCPRCLTALSNEEAEKHERDSHLWHLRYPVEDAEHGPAELVVATTRPETMLGDTAVAVHPDDERYSAVIGKRVRLPITGRLVPVVADSGVDLEFGTGAVKVTPAHDPLDFEIANRHDLEMINIMAPNASMNDSVPEAYRGLTRDEARKKVVAELDASGYLLKTEPHRHAVGQCYRCHSLVEPRLSDQWFVKMKPLADPALAAYKEGRVRFVPERRGDDYERWLTDIRDWCISRQLWWGHRIPAWHCTSETCDNIVVSREEPNTCDQCGGELRQDPDVLDTWFSSWLLPFTALGWPEETPDLNRFYPGDTLVTGADIIFFWVARMIMAGIEFMDDVPFRTVFFNGIVRDAQNRKMSKSLGNGIDPLDVVHRYGADALRFTLITGGAIGTDVLLDHEDLETTFAVGRNFANKVWNVGRLILSNLDGEPTAIDSIDPSRFTLADRWVLSRMERTVHSVTDSIEKFRLNEAASTVYQFVWSELADWYLEEAKSRLYGDVEGGDVARAVLSSTFGTVLHLLHPFAPFITEELWRHLPGSNGILAVSSWPTVDQQRIDEEAETGFGLVQELVGAVRNARAEYNVTPSKTVSVILDAASESTAAFCNAELSMIGRLARVTELETGTQPQGVGSHAVLSDGSGVFTALGDAIDIERECERLGGELERFDNLLGGVRKKLANEHFVSRAPAEVVDKEREKEKSWSEQRDAVAAKLQALGC